MRLVIDSQIPFMRGMAERLGEVTYIPGKEISADDVRHADALVVRTRTRCDRRLLEKSSVRFIATATIGFDHIDTAYLAERGIAWSNCPGCNARSVVQYVRSALYLLAAHGCWEKGRELTPALSPAGILDKTVFSRLTLGIVGVGNVGKAVLAVAREMGFGRVLLCDPPRAAREGAEGFSPLDEVARESDVVTFHTPLTRMPEENATFHMADEAFFSLLKPTAVLVNSSRGEVVDSHALLTAIKGKKIRAAVVDTWENEPGISEELLRSVFLGTPHIAGYSADGKANGTRMSLTAVARHFGMDETQFAGIEPPSLPASYAYYPEGDGRLLDEALRLYDPTRDYRSLLLSPSSFETLRSSYPLRREK